MVHHQPFAMGGAMFLFDVAGATGGRASIRIQALDWAQSGPVIFQCDDDALAVSYS